MFSVAKRHRWAVKGQPGKIQVTCLEQSLRLMAKGGTEKKGGNFNL